MRFGNSAALLLFCALAGCEGSAVAGPGPTPQFAFLNGPGELPNVIRFEIAYAVGIQDPDTDLYAVAGLPDVPSTFVGCAGGTEGYQTTPVQHVGELQDLVRSLANDPSINLHVYRRSEFVGICRSTVLAQGVGRLVATDNDLTFSNTRNNTWGWHMTGVVTMADGGEAYRLNAQNRFEGNADTGVRLLFRRVELH